MSLHEVRHDTGILVAGGAADLPAHIPGSTPGLRSLVRPRRSLLGRLHAALPLLLAVVLPSVLAVAYFGVVAADRYVAEARFVVRSADRSVVSGLGALLQSTGLNNAQDDAHIVQSYILSRSALSEIEARIGYAARVSAPAGDFLARWPNLRDGDTFEGLYDHFLRSVSVRQDLTSGVSTLTVEAFTAEDARLIAATLLDQSEAFVNRMNERALTDALDLARREVEVAEERVVRNQQAFAALRRSERLVDPAGATTAQMALMAELSGQLVNAETEARRIGAASPGSPQLPALRRRIEALQAQITEERRKLAGADGALTESYGAFESLSLEQRFAAEAYLAAQAAFEQARMEAVRKQRYLQRIVEPVAPDDARQPRRLRMILAVIAASLLIYAIGWLLWVNATEHRS